MLDIFYIYYVYTYDEWYDEHSEWELSDDTWWEDQVECWSIPSEQGDFLINMKGWQHATQTS